MSEKERLCDECQGAEEERFKQRGLTPEFNVWGCHPCEVDGEPGYRRTCRDCDGAGFIAFRWLPAIRHTGAQP